MSRRRTLTALLALLPLFGAGIALAGSTDSTPARERALEESCRSYAAAPASPAGTACAEALRSRAPNIVEYGPGSNER